MWIRASRGAEATDARRYETLLRASGSLGAYRDLEALSNNVARELRPVLTFDFLSLALYDEHTETLSLRTLASAGDLPAPPESAPEQPLAHWVVQHQEPVVITEPHEERRFPETVQCMRRRGLAAMCAFPLTTAERRRVGVLLAGSREPRAYDAGDLTFLSLVGNQLALAIDHALAYEALQQALRSERQRPRHRDAPGASGGELAAMSRELADTRLRAERLERRVKALTDDLALRIGHAHMVGPSAQWQAALKAATQVAPTDTTVLLVGESGTGKEVVARYIHRASSREGGPFVEISCAAVPAQHLDSELFGYERGAFTGAEEASPGRIELAAGGVLFLDEVSAMSSSTQDRFLRVLEEREFQRLGGTRALKSSVRIIAATTCDLGKMVDAGDFRADLYERLRVFDIHLPPLRSRPIDILPLSEVFLEDIARLFGRPPAGLTRDAKEALLQYHWPGNVRELHNALERAAILCGGGFITAEHFAFRPERRRASASRE